MVKKQYSHLFRLQIPSLLHFSKLSATNLKKNIIGFYIINNNEDYDNLKCQLTFQKVSTLSSNGSHYTKRFDFLGTF